MRKLLLVSAVLLVAAAPPAKPKTPSEIVAEAPASAWRDIAADDLLVMDLATAARVVIQLAPQFAPVHVANIRALAKGGWWSGAAIYRVQDNYVVQWGNNESTKPLPAGVDRQAACRISPRAQGPGGAAAGICRRLCARAPASPRAGRSGTTRRLALRTSPIATAMSASAATCRPTPARAASSTRSSATRRATSTATSRSSAGSSRASTGLAALPRGTEALGFYKEESHARADFGGPAGQRDPGGRAPCVPVYGHAERVLRRLCEGAREPEGRFLHPARPAASTSATPPCR